MELNKFIQTELKLIGKGAERPYNLEPSIKMPDVTYFRQHDKTPEESLYEVY